MDGGLLTNQLENDTIDIRKRWDEKCMIEKLKLIEERYVEIEQKIAQP